MSDCEIRVIVVRTGVNDFKITVRHGEKVVQEKDTEMKTGDTVTIIQPVIVHNDRKFFKS